MPRKEIPPETPPNPRDPILPGVNPAVADHLQPDEGLPFPIVAIGASAGGTIAAHSAGKPHPPQRILIVDDNTDSAESMGHIFRMAGHELQIVGEGAVATAAAQSFRPDAVLLDIGLPDMDGYAVAREMRHHRELDRTIIIAVTGYGRDEDVRRARAAGIDAHMVKPVDPDTLMEWIVAGRAAS